MDTITVMPSLNPGRWEAVKNGEELIALGITWQYLYRYCRMEFPTASVLVPHLDRSKGKR